MLLLALVSLVVASVVRTGSPRTTFARSSAGNLGIEAAASSTRLVKTHIRLPALVDVPLGSTAEIPVRVSARGTNSIPAGSVRFWDPDIPRSARFISHTLKLDGQGKATFTVKEHPPGVPFDAKHVTVYYVPAKGSPFAPTTSHRLDLRMRLWEAGLSIKFGRHSYIGRPQRIRVALSSLAGGVPVGDLIVSDKSYAGNCQLRVPSALTYADSGQTLLMLDLPEGLNTLTVSYAGDAYFAPDSSNTISIFIPIGGRPDGVCPSNWARSPLNRDTTMSGDTPLRRYGFPRRYGQYRHKALANPNVGTFVVQLNWSDVEPRKGHFHFGKADAELRSAISLNKKVALVLRFQSGLILSGTSKDCGWNYGHAQLLPRWAGRALGPANSFCSHGTALTIPRYWSAGFIALWTGFVNRVAAHFAPYAADIAYVRGPVGLGDEGEAITGPNTRPIGADTRHLIRWGYTPQLWEAWQEDMLSLYHGAFSYAPWVLYTINRQDVNDDCRAPLTPEIPTFQPAPIPCTGRPVEVDVGEWAVDHGFGLAQNSLSSSWLWHGPARSNPSAGSVNTVLAYALKHAPQPFIELQTFQAESYWCNLAVPRGLPPCRINPDAFVNLEQDVSYAYRHGATTMEWYEDDLTNPRVRPVIDLWRQIETFPTRAKIPTVVGLTPGRAVVRPGDNLPVSIAVWAPGISGFTPGGTVVISDDITGKRLKRVQVPPTAGSVTAVVKVPSTVNTHIDLTASYSDTFRDRNHRTGTWLWRSSRSTPARIPIVRGSALKAPRNLPARSSPSTRMTQR